MATIAARIVKNQDALAQYGIQVEKTDGSLKSTYDILAELKPKWDSMTDAQRVALGDTIAGQNQYKVLASVMQNFQHAIDATEVALNSSGSAIKENERYMESLEAKEQAVAAEFEDFANRVLSKEIVGGFLDAKQAALEFINTDFGASITRIVGVGTAAASVAGIIGTMGAKLALVAKQLQAAGAATGVLGILTSPKSLLIIGAVVAGVATLAEIIQATSEAGARKLAALNDQLQETQDKLDEMSGPGSEYDTLIQNVDKLTEADKRRLVVLESQLENLKQQKAEQESAYLAEWQRQQTEKKAETVLVQPDVNDPQGFEHTEIIEYTEAARATDTLRDAFERLNNQRRAGILSQEQYVAGMQDLIDGSAETYNNLKALEGANIALTDEQRAFLGIYNSVQQQVNNVAASMTNAANETKKFGDAVDDAASNASPFTSMLFDANGQLTEYGRQAVQSSSALADLAVKELQASQAAATSNYSNLIAQIQSVASNAMLAAGQLSAMMAAAGIATSGASDATLTRDLQRTYQEATGKTVASDMAAYQKWRTEYLMSQATQNYQSTMDNIKGQIDQLNQYTSTSVGGSAAKTAKNVENTAKRATNNIANYAKEQAEAVSQEIEDMFSKLRDTEEDYWDAKIDALEEQNKEIDRQVQLEEKLKALEEAKNQKVLLYKDGRFQYDTNRAAVASAQYDLNKTWIDVSLDKQKDILTKMKNGALDLIDEWKEKALEQGELTAEDINTLLGEYHDLGNAQYETVAWGTAGISNLIGTGMSVIGNAIAKSKLGQQLGLGNLNQQLANAGAFSGLYTGSDLRSGGTSGADLLNKNFGAGLNPTGTGGGTTKATGKIPTYRSQYGTTTWGGKDLNAPSTQMTAAKGLRESYVEDAIKYGAGISWWLQQMSRPTSDTLTKEEREAFNAWAGLPEGSTFLFPSDYGETQLGLLYTNWQQKAFEAASTGELMDYMQRSAAQKIFFGYDGDINEWYDKTSLDAYRALYFRDPEAAIGNLYTNPEYRLYDALLFSKYFGKKGEIPDFETAGKKAFSGAFEESGPLSIQQLRQSAAVGSGGMSEWATGKILELSVKTQLEQLEAIDKQLEENDARQKTASGEELKQLRLLNKELTGTRKDIIDNFGKYETGVASWDVYGQPTVEREERWATDEELEAIGVTRPSRAKALQAQIDALSAAWWETDDPSEKAKLHRQAEALRAELAEEALNTAGSDASDAMEIDGTPMTSEERYDMMRAQLAENSQAWFDASDAEKARLHDENEAIRRQLEDAGQSYARGTTNARGGLSLVGEDGPEIRVLGRGDGIIPSDVTNNLWKFGQNPHMFMRSYGQSLSNTFNISNLTLPNVHDAQSLVSGLERMAHQYVAQRS